MTLDPDTEQLIRRWMRERGVSFKEALNDAHLAALAVEHRCVVVSYDNDFSRFDGVTWQRPTA